MAKLPFLNRIFSVKMANLPFLPHFWGENGKIVIVHLAFGIKMAKILISI